MTLQNYYRLKTEFNHEIAIVPEGDAGTVYTPEELQLKMVYLMLVTDLENNDTQLINDFKSIWNTFELKSKSKDLLTDWDTPFTFKSLSLLKNYFLGKSIIDLASGTGALLLCYMEWILFLCYHSDALLLVQSYLIEKVTAVDINDRALSAYTDTIKALIKDLGFTFEVPLDTRQCNALIYSFEKKYHYVISNPPYIGEKGHLSIFDPIKATDFGKVYYEGKMDYFYFFIYKAKLVLADNGTACFLTSNYFYTADGAKKLRTFLKNDFHIHKIQDFADEQVFGGRSLHASMYTLRNNISPTVEVIGRETSRMSINQFFSKKGFIHLITSETTYGIINKMRSHSIGDLGAFYDVKQGIVSGADRSTKTDAKDKMPIFVYKISELDALDTRLKDLLKPFYKNSQIVPYYVDLKPKFKILYLQNIEDEETLEKVKETLLPYKERLSARREVVKGVRSWYELTWPRTRGVFEGPKVVVPQRSPVNRFAYVEAPYYASADVYYIKALDQSPYDLKVLTLCLNSKAYFFWLYHQGKRKGSLLELYASPLKGLPVLDFNQEDVQKLKHISKRVWQNERASIEDAFHRDVYDLTMPDQILLDEVEEIVGRKLGLTSLEIQHIEEFMNENNS